MDTNKLDIIVTINIDIVPQQPFSERIDEMKLDYKKRKIKNKIEKEFEPLIRDYVKVLIEEVQS